MGVEGMLSLGVVGAWVEGLQNDPSRQHNSLLELRDPRAPQSANTPGCTVAGNQVAFGGCADGKGRSDRGCLIQLLQIEREARGEEPCLRVIHSGRSTCHAISGRSQLGFRTLE